MAHPETLHVMQDVGDKLEGAADKVEGKIKDAAGTVKSKV